MVSVMMKKGDDTIAGNEMLHDDDNDVDGLIYIYYL
jgi:hypothetical protein